MHHHANQLVYQILGMTDRWGIPASKPSNGSDVAFRSGVRSIFTYSQVQKHIRAGGSLLDLLDPRTYSIVVLYEWRRGFGHWVGLRLNPGRREAYFFSSYGAKPDEEKNRALSPAARRASGQDLNVLNDFLKRLHLGGWTVYYNDHPFQRIGDGTATCGRWLSEYLRSGMNPDDYARLFSQ